MLFDVDQKFVIARGANELLRQMVLSTQPNLWFDDRGQNCNCSIKTHHLIDWQQRQQDFISLVEKSTTELHMTALFRSVEAKIALGGGRTEHDLKLGGHLEDAG